MSAKHILIVEDEVKIAHLLRDYLIKEGYIITCIERGDEALAFAQHKSPDLILLDLMLPGMDGIEICKTVRKSSDVPIIMLTAKVDEIDRIIGLEIGADDYICKPFSPREVVARVKAIFRRVNKVTVADQVHLIAGPILLDTETRKVTADGIELDLTPNEFGLLKVLLNHPNRVFSRNELLNKVQGYDFDGYDRTIDTHIKNLRKKIGQVLPGRKVIDTVYGVGYKLVLEE